MINLELVTNDIYAYGFHIIENFLDETHYHALCYQIQEMLNRDLFKNAKIGLKLNSHHHTSIRSDKIHWLDENSTDPAIQAYLKQINILTQTLNQSLFLGLSEFETHFAAYQPGAFYKKHIDQFSETKNRKISCVYYLNHHWQEQFGGELKLYNQDDQLIKTVFPKGNQFICFNSELPHEVCLTHQPRYSITGWMKTRSMSLF